MASGLKGQGSKAPELIFQGLHSVKNDQGSRQWNDRAPGSMEKKFRALELQGPALFGTLEARWQIIARLALLLAIISN